MPRFVSITKAAILANVPSQEIQNKIDQHLLSSTRGQIHIDDLLECFPNAQLEEADMLSYVTKIKEASFATGAMKSHGEANYVSLEEEVVELRRKVEYHREKAQKYEELIIHLRDQLLEVEKKFGDKHSQRLQAVFHWLEQRLSEIRRNN